MNTKERILKFLLGRAISRKDYDEAKAGYDAALENATDEQKQMASAYLQSVLNKLSADPKTNKHARHMGAEAYRVATTMLNGTFDEAAVQTPLGTTGPRTRRQDYADAGNVAADFMRKNNNRSSSTNAAPTSSVGRYFFNAMNGLNPLGEQIGATRGSLVKSYAQGLLKNISDALSAEKSGKTVYNKINGMYDDIANLLAIINGDTESDQAYNTLLSIAGKYDTADHWRSYFGDLLPGQNRAAQAKKRWVDEGYDFIDNNLTNDALKNYYLANKDGKQYLIKKDYSGFADDVVNFNTDWRNGLEGTGYVIKDGRFQEGDLNQAYADSQNPFYEVLRKYVADLNNDSRAIWKNYNRFTDLSKFNIISDNAAALHGKSVADMSRYFDANVPIIATVEGDNWNALKSKYGHTKVDNDKITYYWKDANGENKSGKYTDLIQSIGDKLNLKKEDPEAGYTNWSSAEINLDRIIPQTEDLWTKDINRYNQFGNFFSNNWYNQVNKGLWSEDKIDADQDIVKNPQGTARMLVQLWAMDDSLLTNEQKRIKNRWWNQYSTDAIYLIYDQLKKNPDLFNNNPKYAEAWHSILKAYKNKITSTTALPTEILSEQNGGVIFAKEGTYIDLAGNEINDPNKGEESNAARVRKMAELKSMEKNALDLRAAQYGRTPYRLKASEESWNTADTLRATALATDVAGLIAAIAGPATGGAGSAVAIGSGFVSMGQDLAADIMDDSVSAGRATKNALINSGLAVGAMFGAKAPKIIKGVLKILPKAMMAAGAAGIVFDPEVHNTLNRMQEGKTMNAADWRNILMVLRTATGIATVGTVSAKVKKGAATWDKTYKGRLKQLTENSELNDNIKYIAAENGLKALQVPKPIYDEVNAKLASAKSDEEAVAALELLTRSKEQGGAGFTPEEAKSVIESVAGKRGYKFWKKEFWNTQESSRLREATPEQIENLTGRDLRADARLLAIQDIRKANQKGWKSGLMKNLEKTKLAESFSPALNKALAGTQYKNIRELISGEKAKLPAYRPNKMIDATKDLTSEQWRQTRQDIANEVSAVREAAAQSKGLSQKQQLLTNAEAEQQNLGRSYEQLTNAEKEIRDATAALQQLETEAASKAPGIRSEIQSLKSELAEYQKIVAESSKTPKRVSAKSALVTQANKELSTAKVALERARKANPVLDRAITTGEDGTLKLTKGAILSEGTRRQANKLIKDYNSKLATVNGLGKQTQSRQTKSTEATKLMQEVQTKIDELTKVLADSAELQQARARRSDAIAAYHQLRQGLNGNTRRSMLRRLNVLNGTTDENGNNTGLISRLRSEIKTSQGNVKNAGREQYYESLSSRGRDLGKTSKTVSTTVGNIPSGATTKSYTVIRDAQLAKKAALLGRPNAQELTSEDIRKIYPSNVKNIRGAAYDPTSNELVIWEQGGKINYSKLRK